MKAVKTLATLVLPLLMYQAISIHIKFLVVNLEKRFWDLILAI